MNRSLHSTKRLVLLILVMVGLAGLVVLPNGLMSRFVPSAQAAGFTWTGAVSSDWFNPQNWSPNGVPGAGDVATINSGTVDLSGDTSVANLNLGGGTLAGGGTLTVTGTLNWTGGDMSGSGTTLIPPGATMNIGGAGFKGLKESRTIINDGTIVYNTTHPNDRFTWQSASAVINNRGLLDFQVDLDGGRIFGGDNRPATSLKNTGTLRKSAGAGATVLACALDNGGTVEVLSGTLRLGNLFTSSTSNGAFDVAGGATLDFAQGQVGSSAHNLTAASSISGAGNLAFSAGVTNIDGAYSLTGAVTITGTFTRVNVNSNVAMTTVDLNTSPFWYGIGGSGTLTITGTLNWKSGRMLGSGTTVIAAGATALLSGAGTFPPFDRVIAESRRLTNNGTFTIANGATLYVLQNSTAVITNNGLFDAQSDGNIGSHQLSVTATFNNAGTFRRSVGTGKAVIERNIAFNNTGTVEVLSGELAFSLGYTQTAGATVLNGGNISTLARQSDSAIDTINLQGGALRGTGTIDANVVNASTTSPGLAPGAAGTLRVTGDYTQTASGILNIEIGGPAAGSQFDQLILGTDALNKTATLGGTLNVSLINGFRPAANDAFEVSKYSSRAGQFSAANGLDIGDGQTFTADYRPNNLVLISSSVNGGTTTGCGGPARPWVHYIAPQAARLHNFSGGTLYTSTVLYGNSGGTGTFVKINTTLKGLRGDYKVKVQGVSTRPLVTVNDPAMRQAFEDMPLVFRNQRTGDRYVPVIVYVPPDNPRCREADGPAGGAGSAGGSTGGSFTITVTTADDGAGASANAALTALSSGAAPASAGASGGGESWLRASGGDNAGSGDICASLPPDAPVVPDSCGNSGGGAPAPPGGGDPCPIEIKAEVDMSECLDALFGLLKSLAPGSDCVDAFLQGLDIAQGNGLEPTGAASFALSAIQCAANFTPVGKAISIALEVAGGVGAAMDILNALEACGLLPNDSSSALTRIVCSFDPNDKVGPRGAGEAHYTSGEEPLPYAVFFENKPAASAPAQDVVITDQLDKEKFDLATFQLGAISFGSKTVVPPPGRSEFNTDVDLRPANDLLVRINARLNKETGLLTWRFASIDPATLQPTLDPLAGFLPPNKKPSEGEGSVLFTVSPKPGLASGTQINNQARIVFDTNAPIDTPVWSNAIDNAKPSSRVQPLAATQNSESFTVQWSGADAESGVQSFTIFVSEDGGPFQVWRPNTAETSAVFPGRQGKSYGFYSLARDHTGNLESNKAAAEAMTAVNADQSSPVTVAALSPPNSNGWHKADVTVTLNATDVGSGVREISYTVSTAQSVTGQTTSGAAASIPVTAEGTTTVSFFAVDNNGNTEAAQSLTIKLDKTPPTIGCPANIVRQPDPGQTTAVLNYLVTAADSHSGVTVVSNPPPGSVFLAGTTLVTSTATDAADNSANCSFTVTVLPPQSQGIAVVRHAPEVFGGQLIGSLWQLSGEEITLYGNAVLSGDLMVPGMPAVEVQRTAHLGSTVEGGGSALPSGYRVRVNGYAWLNRLLTRTDPVTLPAVSAPPLPTGTRDVRLVSRAESAGDFATLRDLTLAINAGTVAVPPGTYGSFKVQGTNTLVLGVEGATTPAVYNLQHLWLEGNGRLQLVGPVVINLATGLHLSGVSSAGDADKPQWLTLNVAAGGVEVNSRGKLYAMVVAPASKVGIYNNALVRGGLICDRLALNGRNAMLEMILGDGLSSALGREAHQPGPRRFHSRVAGRGYARQAPGGTGTPGEAKNGGK